MAKARTFPFGYLLILLLLCAAGGGAYYWAHRDAKGPDYYTTTVTSGSVIQSVTATGTLKPILDILVSSQVSGYISKMYVDFNSKVKAGDVLATLDPSAYQAQVQSAAADVENSKAAAALEKVTVNRNLELQRKGLISQADFDAAEAQLAEANAQVRLKEASLQVAQTNLSRTTLYSPIDGIVIARNVDVGYTVAASLSAPTLFEIGNDLSEMQIDAAVAEADIGNVEEGQTVNFTVDAYPDEEFHGTVYQVRNAPSTQQNVVIYDVMIKVPNDELKLKPGMTANVSIVITTKPSVLRVANSALRFHMPDGIDFKPAPDLPSQPVAAVVAKPKPKKGDQRAALRQVIEDSGWQRENGQATPQQVAKIQELAKARGVELTESVLKALHLINRTDAPVIRTVYLLPGGNPLAQPEAVHVKVGITDGTSSEVIEGLKEGDTVITGSNLPMGPLPGSNSPFGHH